MSEAVVVHVMPELPERLRWFEVDGEPLMENGGVYSAVLIHHLPEGFSGDFGEPGLHNTADGLWYRVCASEIFAFYGVAKHAVLLLAELSKDQNLEMAEGRIS